MDKKKSSGVEKFDNRKIAIYVRKSKITEMGKSIEMQKEKCKALAISKYNIEDQENDIIIYEDDGLSGFYADRPSYVKMINAINNNKIKAVICYKVDRISRRTLDLFSLIQQMEDKKVAFISVEDHEMDTSYPTGKFMVHMLSIIAEFERDIIAERITDNLYELAKEGRWLGGITPLGYASKKEKILYNGRKTSKNHLEPVLSEQEIVKKVFRYFLECNKFGTTAAMLNNEGKKTRRNLAFTKTAVKNILTNPVYAIADKDMKDFFKSFDITIWAADEEFDGIRGIMAYNKTEQIKERDKDSKIFDPKYTQKTLKRDIKEWVVSIGEHKGIISGTDWIRTQNIILDIEAVSARPKETSKALLSGLVHCIDCGNKMFVRTESNRYNPDGSVRFRYVCDVKYRKKGGYL
jgi:site-specific DNA recombinase